MIAFFPIYPHFSPPIDPFTMHMHEAENAFLLSMSKQLWMLYVCVCVFAAVWFSTLILCDGNQKEKRCQTVCVCKNKKLLFAYISLYARQHHQTHTHDVFSLCPPFPYIQEEAAIKKSWQRKIYQKNKQRSEWERKNQLEPAPAAKKSIDEIVCSPWIGLRLASTLWISFMQREIYICGAGDALLIWSSMLMHVTTAKKWQQTLAQRV